MPSAADITIVLKDGHNADPKDAIVHKNPPGGPGDRVRWDNQTTRGRTVWFNDMSLWPFEETPELIVIKKGHKSEWFTVSSSAEKTGCTYKVFPTLIPGVPPDDPKVSVND